MDLPKDVFLEKLDYYNGVDVSTCLLFLRKSTKMQIKYRHDISVIYTCNSFSICIFVVNDKLLSNNAYMKVFELTTRKYGQ